MIILLESNDIISLVEMLRRHIIQLSSADDPCVAACLPACPTAPPRLPGRFVVVVHANKIIFLFGCRASRCHTPFWFFSAAASVTPAEPEENKGSRKTELSTALYSMASS